jgi:hypothetical protein
MYAKFNALTSAHSCLYDLEQACAKGDYSTMQECFPTYQKTVDEIGSMVVAKLNTDRLVEMTALLEQHERLMQNLYSQYRQAKA